MELLLRTVPHAHETLPGFILRVAELNRIYGYVLYRRLGAVWTHLEGRLADTDTAAAIFKMPPDEWRKFELDPCGYQLFTRGELETPEQRFWGRFLGWFCPECFREKHMMKGEWQFPHLPICVDHKIYLLTACPNCGGSLEVNRRRKWLTWCRCGFRYEDAAAECVSEAGISLGRLIRNRLIEDPAISASHPLGCLRLGPLLRLVRFAGQEEPTSSVRGMMDAIEARAAFDRASVALGDWPSSFESTLDKLIGDVGTSTELKAKAYSSRFLGSHFKGDAGQPVRDVFRNWCARTRSSGTISMEESGAINIQHLAGLLLCEPNVIRQIAKTHSIPFLAPEMAESRALRVPKSAVPIIHAELQRRAQPEGFLRPLAARRLLGLTKMTVLAELARDGELGFVLHENYVFFCNADVQALLAKLIPDRLVAESDGATRRILYRNAHGGIPLVALLKAREQEDIPLLSATGSTPVKLYDILLRKKDAARLVRPPTDGLAQYSLLSPPIGDVDALVSTLKRTFPEKARTALPPVTWHTR